MKKLLIMIVLCFVILLGGCTKKEEPIENPNVITLEGCMDEVGAKPSVQGECMTYYYISADELSLYYVKNWKKGIVSWKRYFINEEQYNLQKALYPNAVCKDDPKTILIKEYMNVADMDAHWNSIESSDIYTMVK